MRSARHRLGAKVSLPLLLRCPIPIIKPMHTTPLSPLSPPDVVPIRRVLVSVFDKTGLDRLATVLKAAAV